ncbi:MAG: hypothetical protein LDL33_11120 [Desulfomonile sp.]|nr:hypothetical protein [Desulfomonile sp.]
MCRSLALFSVVVILAVTVIAAPGYTMMRYPCPPPCSPPPPEVTYQTRMVPGVRTDLVPEVKQSNAVIPVPVVQYRAQPVLLKGTPIGAPCGMDPCTKSCPQPFCQVVTRQVPYVTYTTKVVPYYSVCYRPVCRPVCLPQTYKVEAHPLCP